jgi:hypothetical protein
LRGKLEMLMRRQQAVAVSVNKNKSSGRARRKAIGAVSRTTVQGYQRQSATHKR